MSMALPHRHHSADLDHWTGCWYYKRQKRCLRNCLSPSYRRPACFKYSVFAEIWPTRRFVLAMRQEEHVNPAWLAWRGAVIWRGLLMPLPRVAFGNPSRLRRPMLRQGKAHCIGGSVRGEVRMKLSSLLCAGPHRGQRAALISRLVRSS